MFVTFQVRKECPNVLTSQQAIIVYIDLYINRIQLLPVSQLSHLSLTLLFLHCKVGTDVGITD